jgi:hypothetical protein
MKITTKHLQEVLGTEHVSKSKGAFIIRKSYFYRFGYDSSKLAEFVKSKIPNATIIDHGDHWAPFRGGDSVAKGSHFWVRFTIGETPSVPDFMRI